MQSQLTSFSPTIYIISGPSGVGKTTLVHSAALALPNLYISISYTTRNKRLNEKEGYDYHFISHEAFKKKQDEKLFLEEAEASTGEWYGTGSSELNTAKIDGLDIIFTIDWQGARQIRKKFPEVLSIFILPPSVGALKERLTLRHQDSDSVIQERMQHARETIVHYSEYDYLIVNNRFEEALFDLKSIIQACRLTRKKQEYYLKNLLTQLTS